MDFNPSYSLVGIITDQERMLKKYGHDVVVYVNERCNRHAPSEYRKTIPFAHLLDYQSRHDLSEQHKKVVEQTAAMLTTELAGVDFVFTHDFLFQGWYLPYGLGCLKASRSLPQVRWFHWLHSVPTGKKDWWNASEFGPAHKLIFPNEVDRVRIAEEYRGRPQDIRVIPHIKDLRTWKDFLPETCEIIDAHPGIMQADVVCVYPGSVDRLEAKRLEHVMRIVHGFRRHGLSICLVVATQWANVSRHQEKLDRYGQLAREIGYRPGEIVFTSQIFDKKYAVGLPRRILRELWECANLFVFPTREESFGLVLPEAALSSGCFCILNKSLLNQIEISGMKGLYFDFGSSYHEHTLKIPLERYCNEIATLALGRMLQNESIQLRNHFRQHNNYDYLFARYYAPIMAEASTWV
jgi:glycosyltransferase involved in cell wall biosynthesis